MTSLDRHWRRFLVALPVVCATAWLLGASAVAQQSTSSAVVKGTTISVTLAAPPGQSAYAFGVKLPAELAGNVTGITPPSGATAQLTGGPDGSPEVLFSSPVASATFTITGRDPWPDSVALGTFFSFDNASYVPGPDLTAAAPPAPTATTSPSPTTTTTKARSTPAHSSSGSSLDWLWGALIAAGAAVAGAGGFLLRQQSQQAQGPENLDNVMVDAAKSWAAATDPPKPGVPCTCACQATIVGEKGLHVGDDHVQWSLEFAWPPGSSDDVILNTHDIFLVGLCRDFKKIRQRYTVEFRGECNGGGTMSDWRSQWTIVERAADHVTITVNVHGNTHCPDGSVKRIDCADTLIITVDAHCGPDVTDQYIAALNRVIQRLRARHHAYWDWPDENSEPEWDEEYYGPKETLDWFVANGPWINFRPYSQDYGHGEGPFWQPGKCPSCQQCGATVTVLDRCIDNYIIDALMYGVAAGVIGTGKTVMDAGGLLAKALGSHLNADTFDGALPSWELGYDLGRHAAEDPDYQVTRTDRWLIGAVANAPDRSNCSPCAERVPIDGVDWSSMDWSKKNTLLGHGGHYLYDPPAPK